MATCKLIKLNPGHMATWSILNYIRENQTRELVKHIRTTNSTTPSPGSQERRGPSAGVWQHHTDLSSHHTTWGTCHEVGRPWTPALCPSAAAQLHLPAPLGPCLPSNCRSWPAPGLPGAAAQAAISSGHLVTSTSLQTLRLGISSSPTATVNPFLAILWPACHCMKCDVCAASVLQILVTKTRIKEPAITWLTGYHVNLQSSAWEGWRNWRSFWIYW